MARHSPRAPSIADAAVDKTKQHSCAAFTVPNTATAAPLLYENFQIIVKNQSPSAPGNQVMAD
jgi:hypothetical protein